MSFAKTATTLVVLTTTLLADSALALDEEVKTDVKPFEDQTENAANVS